MMCAVGLGENGPPCLPFWVSCQMPVVWVSLRKMIFSCVQMGGDALRYANCY